MGLRISDWKWACVAASCLLGIAAFVLFVIRPGGFEAAIGWALLLLPGLIPAGVISDRVYKLAPSVEPVIHGALIISFSFGWYWTISYALIKISRAIVRMVRA